MLRFSVISPNDRTDRVREFLAGCSGAFNIVVLPGASLDPAGDLVMCEVTRPAANGLVAGLRSMGLEDDGSITIDSVDVTLSSAARRVEESSEGDTVVWDEFEEHINAQARASWSFFAFLTIATMIAAIGVLQDSPIVIVGAMVLGPDFGPVSAICFGMLRRRPGIIATACRTLLLGYAIAIALTYACAQVSYWIGLVHESMLDSAPEVAFITHPNGWTVLVALLAGTAGVLASTGDKSSALVGVFISVTTVPAAGNIAVAIPVRRWHDVLGSLEQLGMNLSAMILAGWVTLAILRILVRRTSLTVRLPAPPPKHAKLARH